VSGSESVLTPMMTHTKLEMPYIHDTEHKVIVAALPYRLNIDSNLDDGAFQMVVLLPSDVPSDAPNQLPKLENTLQQNQNLLNEWLYSLDQQRGIAVDTVRVPRFKFEHSLNLKQLLIDLGAKQIFTKEANFKGITSSSPFFVSDAMHRAVVEVNEEGTVAAAVTAMRMVLESGSYSPVPLHLILDHPFIFLLRSRPGSLRGYDSLPPIIYFMGRYTRPPPATM
jgi:serine protease inhibitor